MTTTSKSEPKLTEYTVTKGNLVTDAEGQKEWKEKVKLTDEQAEPLIEAGVIA